VNEQQRSKEAHSRERCARKNGQEAVGARRQEQYRLHTPSRRTARRKTERQDVYVKRTGFCNLPRQTKSCVAVHYGIADQQPKKTPFAKVAARSERILVGDHFVCRVRNSSCVLGTAFSRCTSSLGRSESDPEFAAPVSSKLALSVLPHTVLRTVATLIELPLMGQATSPSNLRFQFACVGATCPTWEC
jgi:hypothetical protein